MAKKRAMVLVVCLWVTIFADGVSTEGMTTGTAGLIIGRWNTEAVAPAEGTGRHLIILSMKKEVTLVPDGRPRCQWCHGGNQRYIDYHDHEWGVAVHDDRRLFELLLLESFQAGLSWACVLNKREAFRRAFDGFDYQRIAQYDEARLEALSQDASIIRNRLKLRAAVANARIFMQIQAQMGSFGHYIWQFTHGTTIRETGLTTSALSDRISADLRRRGMRFVGSTIIYSYLQAIGVINSHEPGCYLYPTPDTNGQ